MYIGQRCVVLSHIRINPDFVGSEVVIQSISRDYFRAQVVKRVGKLSRPEYKFTQGSTYSFAIGSLRPVGGFKAWAQTKGR